MSKKARDINKAFFLRKEDRAPEWRVINAEGKVVGRLATEIANILRGKDRPEYTPHTDSGDYVVVINAEKVVLTGNKLEQKTYETYSGHISGKKVLTAKQVMEKKPEQILELAVKRMLPKESALARSIFKKLKVYKGASHPHKAQVKAA